jgi:hypothetical protein
VTESESTIIIIYEAKVAPHTHDSNQSTSTPSTNETDNAPNVTVVLRAYAIDVSLSILQYFSFLVSCVDLRASIHLAAVPASKGVHRINCTTLPRNTINKTFPRVTSLPHMLVTSDIVL